MTVSTTSRPTRTAPRGPSTLRLGLLRGRLELRGFFRTRELVVFAFTLPTVLMALLGLVFGDSLRAAGVSAAQVLAAGMIAAGIMSTTFVTLGIDICADRESGHLKRLQGTPLPPAAYLLGKFVLAVVTTIAQVVVMLVVASMLFGLTLPTSFDRWLTLLWVAALGIISCTLLGVAIASVPRSTQSAAAIVQLPYQALQFVSGVFVNPITALPVGLVTVSSFFPLKWMAQGFRSVFLPDEMARFEMAGSWELGRVALVLGAWCVIGLVLCLVTFRWRVGARPATVNR